MADETADCTKLDSTPRALVKVLGQKVPIEQPRLRPTGAHFGEQRRHHGKPPSARCTRIRVAVCDEPSLALPMWGAVVAGFARGAGARAVSVSSWGHRYSPVVFEDINFEYRDYDR